MEKKVYLIDAGMDPKAKEIIEKINKINKPLKYIFLTHEHIDHIRGLKKIKESFPQAKIVAHENSIEYVKGEKILLPKSFIYKILSVFVKVDGVNVDLKVSKDYKLENVKIFHTPGHTSGSLSFLIEDNLFVGDLVITNKNNNLTFPPSKFNDDESKMVESLKKLLKLEFNNLYVGHGNPKEENGKTVLEKFLQEVK